MDRRQGQEPTVNAIEPDMVLPTVNTIGQDCWRPLDDWELEHAAELGRRLRQLRLDARLPATHVADEAGVCRTTVWHLETGRRRTRRSTLVRLLQAVGRPDLVEELVAVAGPALAPESRWRRPENSHACEVSPCGGLVSEGRAGDTTRGGP
jgi:DNA-binding XRE family transcriptional regulator